MSHPTLKDFVRNVDGLLDKEARNNFIQALYNSLPDLIKAVSFSPQIYRAKVLDIDFDGNKFYKNSPRNSIRAQVYVPENSLVDIKSPLGAVFYSAFDPFFMVPIKKGETVWVMYETDKSPELYCGLWLCRVSEPLNNQFVNFINSTDKFSVELSSDEKLEKIMKEVELIDDGSVGNSLVATYDHSKPFNFIESAYGDAFLGNDVDLSRRSRSIYEVVPRFIKRGDELVLMGSNNNMVIFSSGRKEDINNSVGPGAGSVGMVVGRYGARQTVDGKQITDVGNGSFDVSNDERFNLSEGALDFFNDRACCYSFMNFDGDNTFFVLNHLKKQIDSVENLNEGLSGPEQAIFNGTVDYDVDWQIKTDGNINLLTDKLSYFVNKADCVRSIARHSVVLQSMNQGVNTDISNENFKFFSPTKNSNGVENIGSSVSLLPDGIILIETQNKLSQIKIDPTYNNDNAITIDVRDKPQHISESKVVGSIVVKNDGSVIVNSDNISLGNGELEKAALGEKLVDFLQKFLNHTHTVTPDSIAKGTTQIPIEKAMLESLVFDILSNNIKYS